MRPPANPNQHSVLLVTSGYDHTIRFWEALSGICSRTIQHQESQVNRLSISPDKRFLAAAGNQHVRLYDINSANGQPLMNFEGHTGNVTAVQWHCEGKWLCTSSEDGTVKIWDTRSPTIQRSYTHSAPVSDVVIHPNQGELLAVDTGGSVRIWDLGESTCTHELVPEEDVPMRSVTVASDGSMFVAGNNTGNCYVWKMSNHRDLTSLQPVTKFRAHTKYLTRAILSPDTKHLATCSADTTVKIWSTDNFLFTQERVLTGHQRWVWDCAFSADSAYLVSASSDHVGRLWELSSGETIRQCEHHSNSITSQVHVTNRPDNGHHKAAVCIALNDFSA